MPDEFAAAGSMVLSGLCGITDFRAFDTAFAAASGLSIGGPEAAFDSLGPESGAYAADGYIELSGSCKTLSSTPSVFAAAASGYIALSGTSGLTALLQAANTTAFAAANQMNLSGRCRLGDGAVEDTLTTALAAAGSLQLGGVAGLTVVLPSSLATAFTAAGQMELSGRCRIVTGVTVETAFITSGGYSLIGPSRLDSVDPATQVAAYVATGGVEVGATCVLTLSVAPPVSEFAGAALFLLGGRPSAAFLSPLVIAMAAAGGYVIEPTDQTLSQGQEEVFEAWVLSGQAFEPSIFSAFRFNSFAQRGTQTYAAGEDGIYLLGGDDDDGELIHTGARIGPNNYGADRDKHIRGIQMGNCGPDTKVRVVSESGEGVFTPERDDNRVVVSRDIQGREFMIEVQDFAELSQFEITPLRLARR